MIHIGEISGLAEAKACDLHLAVLERNGLEGNAEEVDGSIDPVHRNTRPVGVSCVARECVVEDTLDHACSFIVGVERNLVLVAKAQRAQIVQTQDVIGVGVREHDSIDIADALRRACMRKSGPVSMSTRWPSHVTVAEGRIRRSRGSVEVQTRQSHPSVGTPIEVPLPRIVRTACITLPQRLSVALCNVRSSKAYLPLGGVYSLRSNRIGEFEEHHSQIEESILQQTGFPFREVAFGLIGENSQDIDILACADDIHSGLFAGFCRSTHLHDGRKIDGLDELLKVGLLGGGHPGVCLL